MAHQRWVVDLTQDGRARPEALTRRGPAPVREPPHARVRRLAADGHTDDQLAALTGHSRSLGERTRERLLISGLAAALWDTPGPGGTPKPDEHGRATLIASACATPPAGRTCWTMQLLANALVARQVGGSSSAETVRRELKQHGLTPWLRAHGCLPELSPACGAAMEDVLDSYAEPYEPDRPVVGFDERPLHLVAGTRSPLPVKPGRPRRVEDEYRRHGPCDRFTTIAPLTGRRHLEVTDRRTAVDLAHPMQWLVDEAEPDASVIRVVLDNLHVHPNASLSIAFAPAEAHRLAKRLESHFRPKHGSGLNGADCELAVLATQGVARRLGDSETARREIAARERPRNLDRPTVTWHFTVDQARRKLGRRYPDPA